MELLLYLALVPALGVLAQWLAWRSGLPGILLLLLFGVALGHFISPDDYLREWTGGDEFAGPKLLFPLVSLSVAVIMFEGGLSLKLSELREAGSAALRLCTIGAAITFAGASVAAHYCLGFDWKLALLLGAILVVTGPTVIGPLLRQVRPSRRVASTLKWEGIVIDPIGAVLAVLVFEQLMPGGGHGHESSAWLMLAKTIAIGLVLGIGGGILLTIALRRFWVPDHLHGVSALALALLSFAISNMMAHESGLITVTVLGIWLTNQKNFDIEHIIELKENLRTLLIGCLFIVLGSRVNLSDVAEIGWPGLVFVAALILIVRPVSVFLSLLGSPLNLREQAFTAGLAPRGIVAAAVSSVFALEMQQSSAGEMLPGADQLSTVTFLVIVGTVAVYGLAASPLARWLGLADESDNGVLIAGADHWVRDFAAELNSAGVPVVLVDNNYNKVSQGRIAGLESHCMNILNEHAREDLTLSGIGRLLAMTPNDEVNSLAVRECRTMFDRSRVYQLTFNKENTHSSRGLTRNLMGRELFGEGLTFSHLRDLHAAGARFKTTTLTEAFTFENFKETYGAETPLLCTIAGDGKLAVNTVDVPLVPTPGQKVIAMVASVSVPENHAAKDDAAKDDAAMHDAEKNQAGKNT